MARNSSAAAAIVVSDDFSLTAPPDTKLKATTSQKTVSELDRVIHERIRLGVVSALAVNPALTFTGLKKLLDVTDGNLSVHTRKLEDAGYVECTKTFAGRIPRTEYRLTEAGRKALEKYLAHMESLIQATRAGR